MSGTKLIGIKEAKAKLQDELLDLIAKFEKEWDVNVAYVTLHESYRIGGESAYTAGVEVRVEV